MPEIDKNDIFDYYQEVARSAFADMLHDHERNRKYAIGLQKSIASMKSRGKKANVLDIGTGTGLLAMLASKYGADSVTTLEAFSPVSFVARKIIEENGFKEKIKIVNKHSTLVEIGPGKDMEHRANILVAEVFDTELIGEGAIKTYNHALENLMEEECLSVPESATVIVQLAECDITNSWNTFCSTHHCKCPENVSQCPGNASIHDLQLSQLKTLNFTALTQPTAICNFDFTGKKKIPCNESFENSMTIIHEGRPNTAFFWWEIKMCLDDEPVLSCAPFWAHPDRDTFDQKKDDGICNLIPWRDHWMQGLFYIQSKRKYSFNEKFILKSSHDEFSWWFDTESTSDRKQKPSCTCLFHMTNSRNRMNQINNAERRKIFQEVLSSFHENENILFVGDNNFYALEMSTTSTKILFQENSLCIKNMWNFIDFNKSDVSVVSKLSGNEEISRIFAEPHFDVAVLPWDNITELWRIHQHFKSKNILIHPKSATIFAVPVHFLNLHKIRWPLECSCEGFNHKTFDEVIDLASTIADENVEPFSLWEYPCYSLGAPKAIFNVNFINDKDIGKHQDTLEIEKTNEIKLCNGVAFWIEWEIDDDKFLSCGPRNSSLNVGELIPWKIEERQAVHLIPSSKVHKIQGITIETQLKDERLALDFTYCYQQKLD